MELKDLSIRAARERLAAKEITATALCEAALARIEELADLNAFLSLTAEAARAQAERLDRLAQAGEELPPLAGTVLAVKDNLVMREVRTTAGSKMLANYLPPYTATIIERLEAAGVIVIGKTNCDEFAMGSSNENSAYGAVKNPWDRERVPGGSSGGSAVAVAAGMAMAALGSDTGGSIRQPASFCGVVGFKPTYGRVSRYGLIAFGSSLDQIGPFTNSVEDAAQLMQVIAGHDANDSTTSDLPVEDYLAALDERRADNADNSIIKGLRVGVPREYYGEGLDAEVRQTIEAAIDQYRELGAEIVEVSLPHTEYAVPVYYLLATAEASSNLARFDGVRYGYRAEAAHSLKDMYNRTRDEGFGAEVKRRIMLGTYALSAGYYDAYYGKAQKVRALIERDFREAFTRCDVMVTPTAPTPPFQLGEKTADPLAMYLSDIYTITLNLAGVPGLVLPCKLSADGLPIGVQLIGRHFDEARLLGVGRQLERAINFTARPRGVAEH